MTSKVKVLLVDDHPLLRQGIRVMLEESKQYQVCGETDDGPPAVAMAMKSKPHVAVIDITLRSGNGLELIKTLKAQVPDIRILVLSMRDENLYGERALRAGANGFLMKHHTHQNLVEAIECILAGEIYASAPLRTRLFQTVMGRAKTPDAIDTLTDRELEILELLGEGHGTREISRRLNLSFKTVDSYRETMKHKLGTGEIGGLVRYAVDWVRRRGE